MGPLRIRGDVRPTSPYRALPSLAARADSITASFIPPLKPAAFNKLLSSPQFLWKMAFHICVRRIFGMPRFAISSSNQSLNDLPRGTGQAVLVCPVQGLSPSNRLAS